MIDKEKQLDEALKRLSTGAIGTRKELYWDRARHARDLTANKEILKVRGQKISKALKGNPHSAKHAHKRMKCIKAYKVTEYRKGTRWKPAAILAKEYIGTFDNAYRAAEELNLYQADISNVLRDNSIQIQTRGYTFEFVDK